MGLHRQVMPVMPRRPDPNPVAGKPTNTKILKAVAGGSSSVSGKTSVKK